ncbi:MAG: heme o synthase [Pyrinomonadaceae bacterium]
MNTVAVEIVGEQIVEPRAARLSLSEKLAAYVELTKPRITLFIVLIAAAGFTLAPTQAFNYGRFLHAMAAIALLSSGVAALNQFMERRLDARMRRTSARPLPSNRIAPSSALLFGLLLTSVAEIYLWLAVNPLTAVLGLTVVAGYVGFYTPLKTKTSLSTVVGAFPGAMPPLMGWTAATDHLTLEAWALFAILFLWQFPHFLAIAWMYREDYGKAGIMMLPVVESDGRTTGQQIVVYALLLLPVSLFPAMLGIAGALYSCGALALGAFYLWSSIRTARRMTNKDARRLLFASIIYLPALFVLMVLDNKF